ncbi:MAG TPA: DNA polymerase III subunit delta [Gaiellaceae bacterium]|jgi:DNA polymerase-3 subunit delta|nr:DNA polymerase III subunit delta [Gaiellaceae bacterium]
MPNELKAAYLIAGTDRPKIDRAVDRLRRRFGPDSVEILRASDTLGEDAVAACNALGLFASEGRLIVVEGVEGWKADDAKAVTAYLKEPAPETTLALVGGELKKDAPIAKAVHGGKGELLLFEAPKNRLQQWVSEQFSGVHNTKVEPEACRALLELVGDDLYELASEIDKLATWADGERITATDVERLVPARAETTNFALTDAWGARDVAGVLHASEGLLERSGDPRSKTIPRVVGILTSHVAKIRRVQALEAQGIAAKDAAVQLRQHPYYVGKLYAQSRRYTSEELRAVTVRLADLDHAIKGGSRLASDLELERALIAITQ